MGQIAAKPQPAYCDRAMLALVKELSARVHAFDPQKVFLASDCIGISGFEEAPGYAMVAHGTFQDTHCEPVAWSYGLFPNWRKVLWSCNWNCVSNFAAMRWGVKTFARRWPSATVGATTAGLGSGRSTGAIASWISSASVSSRLPPDAI